MKNVLKISIFLSVFAVLGPVLALSVKAEAPVIYNLIASPSSIESGESSSISWSAPEAIQCDLTGGATGYYDSTDSVVVTPKKSTTYSVTCWNWGPHGGKDARTNSVSVTVGSTPFPTPYPTPYPTQTQALYPSVNLYANTNSIFSGQSAVLSWNTSNAYSCFATNGWSGSKNLNGSEQVYPYTSTTYTLTCTSYTGHQSTDSETIYVNQFIPQPTPTPTPVPQGLGAACSASPSSPRIGNSVTFTAFESGGNAPYYYSWSGEISGTSKSVSRTFPTTGNKTATVRITDALGRVANGTCSTNVSAAPAPTPTPTPGQVQGATTVCKTVTLCIDAEGKITQKSGETIQPSVTPTPTPTPTEVSKTETTEKSFLASIFSISDDTWARIKSLLKWYLAILAIILFVAIAYFVIKRVTGKEVK